MPVDQQLLGQVQAAQRQADAVQSDDYGLRPGDLMAQLMANYAVRIISAYLYCKPQFSNIVHVFCYNFQTNRYRMLT